MQQITDHINCFEYRQSAFKTDDSVAYIIEWFSESNESLKKLSLCESANGVIYNDKHYQTIGEYDLYIDYFERIFDYLNGRSMYRIPPKLLSCLFACETSEEFWEIDMPFYDTCENFRDKANIDSDNNVVLFLTDEQKMAWLIDNDTDTDIEQFDAMDGVEISDDYSRLQ